jgi:tight adherence protein B
VRGGESMFVIIIAVLLGIGCWGISYTMQPLKNYINRGSPPKVIETKQVNTLIDYSIYELTFNEKVIALLISAVVVFMIAFIFYKDILLAFLLSTSCFYFLRIRRQQLLLRRKSELNDQFKQALFSLSSSLSAGRSFENSIIETVQDLQMLYANPQTYIIVEFNIIVQKLRNGENVEAALRQFSERADMDDIRNFSDVLSICKRSGGNLVEVIRRTAAMIGEKIELQQDISLLVAQKRFESRILSFAPLIIVALLSFSSPDYMLPLYEGIIGHLIMTAALILLFLCFTLTNKIMDIQVQSK